VKRNKRFFTSHPLTAFGHQDGCHSISTSLLAPKSSDASTSSALLDVKENRHTSFSYSRPHQQTLQSKAVDTSFRKHRRMIRTPHMKTSFSKSILEMSLTTALGLTRNQTSRDHEPIYAVNRTPPVRVSCQKHRHHSSDIMCWHGERIETRRISPRKFWRKMGERWEKDGEEGAMIIMKNGRRRDGG
jgi:hypothetical protein